MTSGVFDKQYAERSGIYFYEFPSGACMEIWPSGAMKIEVGGSAHIRNIKEWHALAVASFAPSATGLSSAERDLERLRWLLILNPEKTGLQIAHLWSGPMAPTMTKEEAFAQPSHVAPITTKRTDEVMREVQALFATIDWNDTDAASNVQNRALCMVEEHGRQLESDLAYWMPKERPQYGAPESRDVDVAEAQRKWDAFQSGQRSSTVALTIPEGLHPETAALVKRFAEALAEKLRKAEMKYGYSDFWKYDDWKEECQAKLAEHMAKGDPRDVANYCAFMWHHGWPTVAPSAIERRMVDDFFDKDGFPMKPTPGTKAPVVLDDPGGTLSGKPVSVRLQQILHQWVNIGVKQQFILAKIIISAEALEDRVRELEAATPNIAKDAK